MALLYIGCFLGFGALAFQSIFLAVDFFKLGASGITAYYLGWLIPSGFILFPLLTWFKKSHPSLFIPVIGALEIIGLWSATWAITDRSDPIMLGFINALVVTGYFQLFHLALAGVTSDARRTRELAISKIAAQIGGICGASLGGFLFVDLGHGIPFFISAVCYVIATLALAVISPKVRRSDSVSEQAAGEVHAEPLIWAIFNYPRQNIGVVLEAFADFSSIYLLPVLLLRMGFEPTLIGLLHATRLTAALVLAPIAQRTIASGNGREFLASSLFGIAGWLLFIQPEPVFFISLIASILLGCKGFLLALGLETRWYARRSMSQILARELVLTAARIIAIPLLACSAFKAPTLYLAIGLGSAILIYSYGLWLTRSAREGAL